MNLHLFLHYIALGFALVSGGFSGLILLSFISALFTGGRATLSWGSFGFVAVFIVSVAYLLAS